MTKKTELPTEIKVRAQQIADMRHEIIRTLTSYGASGPEAAYAFGLILGPACNEMSGIEGYGTPRENRKALLGQVDKGMKDTLSLMRQHEFKTGAVDE